MLLYISLKIHPIFEFKDDYLVSEKKENVAYAFLPITTSYSLLRLFNKLNYCTMVIILFKLFYR